MLGLQLTFAVCLFIFVALSYLIPILLLRGKIDNHQTKKRTIQELVCSCCNCASAGVFIAIFFLGLLPNVRNKFETLFRKLDIDTVFPTTECVIVGGYFLCLSFHQFYLACKKLKLSDISLSDSQEFEQRKSLLNEFELDNLSPNSTSQDEINFTSDSTNPIENKPAASLAPSPIAHTHVNPVKNVAGTVKVKKTKHNHMIALTEQASGVNFIVLVMATSVHAIFEGTTLALQTTTKRALHLFIAILVHECLVALALGLNTAKLKLPLTTIVKFTVLFSSALPIGVFIGLGLGRAPGVTGDFISAVVQGVASGTFLHIIFQELIPLEFTSSSSNRLLKLLFMLLGFVFFAVVTYFLMEQ